MLIWDLEMRGCDDQGCGYFGASRGSRKHVGIDLACTPGTTIDAPVSGIVTKLGRVYSDPNKAHLRYVQITTGKYDYRMYYVKPTICVGAAVAEGDPVGVHQKTGDLYRGITEHVHFEIKDPKGKRVDPTPVYLAKRRFNVASR